MKKLLILVLCGLCSYTAVAQEVDSAQILIDAIESNMNYQHGDITFADLGVLHVPDGFRYLDSAQAHYVIHDLWGNPHGGGTLGMIVPENIGVADPAGWAFIVSYEESGYVKDDDADDIDYDDLLEEMQADTKAANEARMQAGYESIELVGWAAKPYYDQEKKALHWAKDLKFGESEQHTLNYSIRVLGRKGVLELNAVASTDQLGEVQKNIEPVLASFTYTEGSRYSDFNPDIDEVAAWTIGGLVAGKVLAKAGILALVLKNIKLIGLAIAGLASAGWRWFRKKTVPPDVREIAGENPPQDSQPS
jgi:uncharacterized membrane-anchored protein